MKSAFLILAHTEFEVLKLLVSCLDDPRNDIYVHFDKKVKILPELHTERAGLTVLDRRIDVRWGAPSMIEAEFVLFDTALARGPYQYYHLLSGVDLPLKSQDRIHAFFEEHAGQEFIGYTLTEMTPETVRRMQRWHLFPRHFGRRRDIYSAFRSACLRCQELLGIKRNRGIVFTKGSQWVSLTEAMVQYILGQEDQVRKTFTHTFVPDECVMQTLCWNSPYRDRLYSTASDGEGCMRLIGWRGSELVDWSAADYDELAASPALFARKFNSADPAFIQKIVDLSK